MALDKSTRLEIAAATYEDPALFLQMFLKDYFPLPLPWIQRGILAMLTNKCKFLERYGELDKIVKNFVVMKQELDPDTHEVVEREVSRIFHLDDEGHIHMTLSQHDAIIVPRGIGKTSIAGVGVVVYNTVFKEVFFTLYTSHAENHAAMQLDNVKRQLESNEKLIEVFGVLKPERSASEKWSSLFFETTSGVAAAARGSGGQVRGLNHRGFRPDLVIVDDLEDREEVKTDSLREKTRTWFMQDLKPVLPKIGRRGRITVLGTITHEDCLVQRLSVDPEWSCVKLGALDMDGEPLWDQYMTVERLEAEKASFARQGNLRGFYMEYMSKTVAAEAQVFKQEMFRYGRPPGELVAVAVAMDPAISEKRTADETVIAVVGMTDRGYLRVLDMWGARTQDDLLKLNTFFDMIKKWHALDIYAGRFGIESVAYQATLVHSCREMMARKGMYFEIQAITHKTKKAQRIKGILQPRLAAGYLYFGRAFPELETQLLEFREDDTHLHDDWPDAVSMAVALLDDFAPQAAGKDTTTDEYPPLEDMIGGDPEWVH